MSMQPIRDSIVEGLFYPEDPVELGSAVTAYLKDNPGPRHDARVIMAPHAAYQYAGPYLGAAFNAASGVKPKRVVVLAPLHREGETRIFLSESRAFRSPLGLIEVDHSLDNELENSSTHIMANDIPHLEEHGIEVHLPFIQTLFPNAALIPLLVGDTRGAAAGLVSRALSLAFNRVKEETLFVLSLNMPKARKGQDSSHNPAELLSCLTNKTGVDLSPISLSRRAFSCGDALLYGFFDWLGQTATGELLREGDSTETDPSSADTVHYAALAFWETGLHDNGRA